jgi:hypothetical protein
MVVTAKGVKRETAAVTLKEFFSLEGLLSIVQTAKDNLNPKNFTIKLRGCFNY